MKKIMWYILVMFSIIFGFFGLAKNTLASEAEYFLSGVSGGVNFAIDSTYWKRAKWNSSTKKFSGKIYIQGIGLIELDGVQLSCYGKICNLSRNIITEQIGTLNFNLLLHLENKKLSGTIISPNTGDSFRFENILLTENEINIANINELKAGKNITLLFDQKLSNDATMQIWETYPNGGGSHKSEIITDKLRPDLQWFHNLDITRSGSYYTFILHTHNKTFYYNNITIHPSEATQIDAKIENNNLNISLKDTYNNAIKSGDAKIFFRIEEDTQIPKKFQIPPSELTRVDENIFEKKVPVTTGGISIPINFTSKPKIFSITKIKYNNEEIKNFQEIHLTDQINTPIEPTINIPNSDKIELNNHTYMSINFGNTTGLTDVKVVGMGNNIEIISEKCELVFCKNLWSDGVFIATPEKNNVIFRAKNTGDTTLETFVYFKKNGNPNTEFFFKTQSQNLTIIDNTINDLELLGSNFSFGNINPTHTSGNNSTKPIQTLLLNQIRKNIGYLSRNYNSSANNFQILRWNNNNNNNYNYNYNDSKQTMIVLDGDITINNNIPYSPHYPKAIIAINGNIKIAPNVTDIHATLIAGKSILSTDDSEKSYQLYILGSVIADNIQDTFKTMRAAFNNTDDIKKSEKNRRDSVNDRIIIEYDNRIAKNPPPGLENIRE